MAILEMVDKLTDALDNRSCAKGIFIDLAKAFDTADHKILLQKLSHYGIRGLLLDLLNDCMTGRKQYDSYNGMNSRTSSFSHIC